MLNYTVGELLPDEHWIQTTPMAPMGSVQPGFDLFMTDAETTSVNLEPLVGFPLEVHLQGVPFEAGGTDDGDGTVTVSGGGSSLTNSVYLYVGSSGSGTSGRPHTTVAKLGMPRWA